MGTGTIAILGALPVIMATHTLQSAYSGRRQDQKKAGSYSNWSDNYRREPQKLWWAHKTAPRLYARIIGDIKSMFFFLQSVVSYLSITRSGTWAACNGIHTNARSILGWKSIDMTAWVRPFGCELQRVANEKSDWRTRRQYKCDT